MSQHDKRTDCNLECVSCGSVVSILIPANLSTKFAKSLTEKYQRALADSHKAFCSFRKPAQELFGSGKSYAVVPYLFARVLPSDSLELIEQLEPVDIFTKRFSALYDFLDTVQHDPITVPVQVLQYSAQDDTSLYRRYLQVVYLQLLEARSTV